MPVIEGKIIQLQKLSVDDGAGIRTVIFMAGCPLRCRWCSNPESWDMSAELAVPVSVYDVVKQIERDDVFFRYSGGGVTFSGGEPTFQTEFLRSLALEFEKRGVSMWIETCGYFDFDRVRDIFKKMEHVFYDIKLMDSAKHEEYTGVGNSLILKNAALLHELGIPITVRMPAVKGVNFTEENLAATSRFMKENLPGADIEFLPYHDLGKEKYEALGLMSSYSEFTAPNKRELEERFKLLE